jgi:hypothetical protein
MTPSLVVSIGLVLLVCIEWFRRSHLARILAVLMAAVLLWFSQPLPRRAARTIHGIPPEQRVTKWSDRDVDDYTSGVLTMERAMGRDIELGSRDRSLAVAVLVWLAISPMIPRRRSMPESAVEGSSASPAA